MKNTSVGWKSNDDVSAKFALAYVSQKKKSHGQSELKISLPDDNPKISQLMSTEK